MTEPIYNCEGTRRRDFLKLGVGSFMGLGMVDLLRQRAQAAQVARAAGKSSPANVNCIMIWLDGGPSHYESFDPKPDAPTDIRGEFKPIKTAVPGVYFSEVIPKLAGVADRLSIVRSICHKDPNHGGGNDGRAYAGAGGLRGVRDVSSVVRIGRVVEARDSARFAGIYDDAGDVAIGWAELSGGEACAVCHSR